MALRIGQTPLIIEDAIGTGHLRVGQAKLSFETVIPNGHIRVGQAALILETSPTLIPALINGNFQDPLGNAYSFGSIHFVLSQSATYAAGASFYANGYRVTANLDATGSIIQPFNIIPNSLLVTAQGLTNTYYRTKVYKSNGQLVWSSPIVVPNIYPTVDISTLAPVT